MRRLIFWIVLIHLNNICLFGQEVKGKIAFGPFGSAVKMVFGKVDHSTIDQWAGFSVGYGVSEKLLLSLDGGYGWVYSRDPNGSQFASSGGFKTLLYPLNLNMVWFPSPEKRLKPFLSFGGGGVVWDVRSTAGITSFLDRGTSLKGSTVSPAFSMAAGLDQALSQAVSASVFVKLHYLLKGNEDTIGTGDDNRAVVEVGLGLKLWHQGNRDLDGDGISDRNDLCVGEVEDYDGYQDLDGCPDGDNDEDGVADLQDDCPGLAEDADGFEDDDGCPDLDNDNDGITDSADQCPGRAEDFDGFEDMDGCPDPDNDGDGVVDENDRCPSQAETPNAFEDEDGCPDVVPLLVDKETPLILRGINFPSGSAILGQDSYGAMDSVYQSLVDNPEVEIEIRGYTDSQGEWAQNLQLSQMRADAVKQHLVFRGIAANRMLAVGYGESNPIATNRTPEGRARNRRIEFVRVD